MHGWKMRVSQIALGLAIVLSCAGLASAEQRICPICGRASNDQAPYAEKAGATLARGVSNTVFGWTELIRQPADEVKAGGNVFTGIGKGVSHTVTRTISGLGEVLTFWTPKTGKGYLHLAHDCPLCMKSAQKK